MSDWELVDFEPVEPLGADHQYRMISCSCGLKRWCDRTTATGKVKFTFTFITHLIRGHRPRHTTVQAKPSEED